MKATITSTPESDKVTATDDYSIHLVPESDQESKLLSLLFEKFAMTENQLEMRYRISDVFYNRMLDGKDTTFLKITVVSNK